MRKNKEETRINKKKDRSLQKVTKKKQTGKVIDEEEKAKNEKKCKELKLSQKKR